MAFDAAKAPRAIQQAIVNAMRQSAGILKDRAISNLDRVLKRKSGDLATSIYARAGRTRFGGYLQVGTKLKYGRFWEMGFKHGRQFFHRPWLRPAVEQSQAEVARRIQIEVDRAIGQQFGNVTIDIKIPM